MSPVYWTIACESSILDCVVDLPSDPALDGVLFSLTVRVKVNMLAEGTRKRRMHYRVLITTDEDGAYTAECPSLPGCISQGPTRELALQNIQDAIKGYLESLRSTATPSRRLSAKKSSR